MRRYLFWSSCLFFLCLTMVTSSALAEEDLPGIIRRVKPSIVAILTYDREGRMVGMGSGFFINQDGDVVTNYHVLQGVSRAEVKTDDGSIYPINKVLAEDKEGDLIRVSLDSPGGPFLPLSVSSSIPEVGERVFVVGSPLGLEKTVSDGIVSAIREVPEFGKIVQVTAPISPGSSGSPVINMKGAVIGVATFYLVAGQNLNFAVPGERVTRLPRGEAQTLRERDEAKVNEKLALAERLYTTGLRFLWVEDYEKALPYFEEAVKKTPNNGEAHFQIGYCYGKLGRYREAIGPYKEAIRIKPNDVDPYNNLCVAFAMVGQYQEALETCRQAIRIKPHLAEAHNNLAWSYHKVGRYQEAIESCKEAIRIDPRFALAHFNLGNNYSALKKYEEAIESYKQAIRIDFNYAEGHLNLGAAYNQIGRLDEAIESYRQAIRIKPDLAEAYLNLGMTYLRLGDRGSALEAYRTLRTLDGDLADKLFNLIYE